MAYNNRHDKNGNGKTANKKANRSPYSGFDTHKRDAKGHFVKQDKGDKAKTHTDGYNCYKNAKPFRVSETPVKKDDVVIHDIVSFIDTIANEIVGAFEDARNDYEKKPIYSRAEMDRALDKTRKDVYQSVRKYFKAAFRNGILFGACVTLGVSIPAFAFQSAIVTFVKGLFA